METRAARVEPARPALPVPYALELPDRARKERYYDPDFFRLEAERLWSRTWQMACRLEEIPRPHDYATYEILDQSVVVVRTEDLGVTAFHNACRHRGVRVAGARGTCEAGFTCPFHGWCYGPDGRNTFVPRPSSFSEHNLDPGDLDLRPVRAEVWGGCAWINLDDGAPPLRPCIEPFATVLDAWKLGSMHPEWWVAVRLPLNWKLAEEAFMEQYHVIETHPQLVDPRRFPSRDPAAFDPRAWLDAEIRYLHTMSEGMAGMVHASDVRVAEGLRDIDLPVEPGPAITTWNRTLNDAVVRWHRGEGHDVPDLNELEAQGLNEPMGYCFPHFFVLPMYSSASSYRFRPLGPEETLMEIWSLTRFPDGDEPPRPDPPEWWAHDDPRLPPIPQQDFANLPRQQLGVHSRGFEHMRFAERIEGGIANFERTVDGFLAGLPHETLLPALRAVNVNPLERPVADLGFSAIGSGIMGTDPTFAEVAEGVRATIAAYTQALDDGRTDDVVATFCPDGVSDIPGLGTFEGHDALRAAYAGWTPTRPQRHLVLNTLVTRWSADEAEAVSDVVLVLKGESRWSIQLVGRYHDTLHRHGDGGDATWRFHRRVAAFEQG